MRNWKDNIFYRINLSLKEINDLTRTLREKEESKGQDSKLTVRLPHILGSYTDAK